MKFGNVGSALKGSVVGEALMPGGGVVGAMYGNKYGKNAEKEALHKVGLGTRRQDEAFEKQRQSQLQQQSAEKDVFGRMNQADDGYYNAYKANEGIYKQQRNTAASGYLTRSSALANEASQQANNAQTVYKNDIAPRQKGIMEDAQREAGNAMSLRDAGDPNNAVHQAVRGMYDQRAQHAQQQGLSDYGVLAALGSQATAQQFGAGGPMTGGQLSVLQNANMGQASQAVARAQQYANSLRDQGIDRGFQESDAQYQRGQGAKDRYNNSVADYMNLEGTQQNRMRGFRDEQQGYNADRFGVQQGLAADNFNLGQQGAGIKHGNAMNAGSRELQNIGSQYGGEQSYYGAQAASDAASQQAKFKSLSGGLTGGLSAAGGVFGGMFGGPAGAAAGSSAGSSAGNAIGQAGQANTYSPAQFYNPQQQQPPRGYAQGQPYSYGNGYGY